MMLRRAAYRIRQFWSALRARPRVEEMHIARQALAEPLFRLFQKMQPTEQAHSLVVYQKLVAQGENDPDLLAAALLHDMGKIRAPLNVWERAWIVILRASFPKQVPAWGCGQPTGWRKALVVAEQHPAWGAELAHAAGANERVTRLIRDHQAPLDAFSPLAEQLQKLKAVDDES